MSDVKLRMAQLVSGTLSLSHVALLLHIGANRDYYPLDINATVFANDPTLYDNISIIDNDYYDYYYYSHHKKYFFFHLTGEYGVELWIEICIEDDEYSML